MYFFSNEASILSRKNYKRMHLIVKIEFVQKDMLWKFYLCARIDKLYFKNICMKYYRYIDILLQLKLDLIGKHKCHFRSICLFFNFKKRNFFLRIVSFSSTYTVYRIFLHNVISSFSTCKHFQPFWICPIKGV